VPGVTVTLADGVAGSATVRVVVESLEAVEVRLAGSVMLAASVPETLAAADALRVGVGVGGGVTVLLRVADGVGGGVIVRVSVAVEVCPSVRLGERRTDSDNDGVGGGVMVGVRLSVLLTVTSMLFEPPVIEMCCVGDDDTVGFEREAVGVGVGGGVIVLVEDAVADSMTELLSEVVVVTLRLCDTDRFTVTVCEGDGRVFV
jgi:hypothetical protein